MAAIAAAGAGANRSFTKQTQKDAKKLSSAGLKPKAEALIERLKQNPYINPPPSEKLIGDLEGAYSRRINFHNRLVYQVLDKERVVKVFRMWTHYAGKRATQLSATL